MSMEPQAATHARYLLEQHATKLRTDAKREREKGRQNILYRPVGEAVADALDAAARDIEVARRAIPPPKTATEGMQ